MLTLRSAAVSPIAENSASGAAGGSAPVRSCANGGADVAITAASASPRESPVNATSDLVILVALASFEALPAAASNVPSRFVK